MHRTYSWLLVVATMCGGPSDLAPLGVADEPVSSETPRRDTGLASSPEATQDSRPTDVILWLRNGPKRHVEAAGFQGITPGQTSAADLEAKLGRPAEQSEEDGRTIAIYRIGPFPQVRIGLKNKVVASIEVTIDEKRPLESLIEELGLQSFALTVETDAKGEPQSVLIPERGLRFTVVPGQTPPEIAAIDLRVPRAEDLILRARSDDSLLFREQLADYEEALRLDPHNAHAYVGIARLWDRLGYTRLARERLASADAAVASAPMVQLELTRLRAKCGETQEAREALQELLPQLEDTPWLKCRAQMLLADVMARQIPPADARQVVQLYVQSIETAKSALQSPDAGDVLEAREVLLLAHGAAACFIAESTFRNKQETAAKWLSNAEAFIAQGEQDGGVSPLARWDHWSAQLRCQYAAGGSESAERVAQQMSQWGDQLLTQVPDELAQRHIRWLCGQGLLWAARTLLMYGDASKGAQWAERAAQLLADNAQRQPPHAPSEAGLAHAYYLLGSIEAIAHRDHQAAIRWYDRALAPLDTHAREPEIMEAREAADELISMAISYWETGARNEAVRWTERGLAVLRDAAAAGQCPESAQSVACHNLVFMYRALGQTEKAAEMSQLAARWKDDETK